MTAPLARILVMLTLLVSAVAIATAIAFYVGDDRRSESPGLARALDATSSPTAAGTATVAPSSSGRSATATTLTGTPSPSRTTTATAARGVSVLTEMAVNVRLGPGVNYAVLSALQPGEPAQATGRNPDASWLVIDTPAGSGWVAAGVVEVSGEPFSLPIVEPGAPVRPAATAPMAAVTPEPSSAIPARTASAVSTVRPPLVTATTAPSRAFTATPQATRAATISVTAVPTLSPTLSPVPSPRATVAGELPRATITGGR